MCPAHFFIVLIPAEFTPDRRRHRLISLPRSSPILINTSFVMYLRSVGRSASRFIAFCKRALLVSSIVFCWYRWILEAVFYLEWAIRSAFWESYSRILPSGGRKKRIYLCYWNLSYIYRSTKLSISLSIEPLKFPAVFSVLQRLKWLKSVF